MLLLEVAMICNIAGASSEPVLSDSWKPDIAHIIVQVLHKKHHFLTFPPGFTGFFWTMPHESNASTPLSIRWLIGQL